MIKTKFVFAVSLVAMLAVGSAWASAPGKNESVDTAHTVYTDQSPTSTEVEGGTAIAGVTYVNRAVNKAGSAATAAEQHAAAAGKSALAAAESAAVAASSAQSAKDTLVKKQPISTANYQMGNASGSWTTMTTEQQDALNSGVTSETKVTHTASTAVGSPTVPVYVNSKGVATAITSYEGTAAKATADASGNNIVNTYATKAQLNSLGDTQSGLVTDVNELKTGKQDVLTAGANITIAEDGTISAKDTVYTLPTASATTLGGVKVDTVLSSTSTNPVQNKVINTALGTKQVKLTATGGADRPVYAIDGGVAAVTGMSIPYGKESNPTSWATIWVE